MPRRKTGRRRGRPRDPQARRRATTRRGRRGESEPIDRGSERLRENKRRVTSREDVEATPAGVLYGHGHLDRHHYDMIGYVTSLLHQEQCAMGGTLSVAGVWSAVTGALAKTTAGSPPIIGDNDARRILERICARLDGSKALVLTLAAEDAVPAIVVRAIEHRLTPMDLAQLENLRHGLDGLSPPRWWAAAC